MGFTTGFTGGVTLTLSLAYLTVLAHQRNRERQSAILRGNTTLISSLTDPLPPVYPPTRAELAAKGRANLLETAKDKWNAEVEGTVRWAQETDWDEVRENVETAVGRLWAKAFGEVLSEAEEAEKKAGVLAKQAGNEFKREVRSSTTQARSVASEKASGVADAAKAAYVDAKARGSEVLTDAKARGSDAVNKGEQKAEEAKGSMFSAVGKGIALGKEALGFAKEKVEGKVNEKLDPVEKTLRQRYEKPSGVNQSIDEALAERYVPVDKRDNAVLRGV
ncbi:hypothetical protein BJ170DRAFT_574444 [Xylariales sp. AK1849]|nr:hypothetical protein BJ170DRAFT_574444 [Xylariales sp. AK1849]